MTTIATDAVFYDDAEMIRARAQFFPVLQIDPDQIGPILGKYYLATADRTAWVTCGLNGCNQTHRMGFVISNKAGQETICGATCGQKRLGTAWVDVAAEFKLREDAAARKRVADDLVSKRESLLAQCAAVLPRAEGATGLMKQFRLDFQPRDAVWRALVKSAKQGGVVTDSVQRKGNFHERPRSETIERIGVIRGSEAIQNDRAGLAALIRTEIEPWLRQNLTQEAMASLDKKSLDAFTRKASGYAAQLIEAEKYVGVIKDLITANTFQLLQKMRDRKLFPTPGSGWDQLISEWSQRISIAEAL